MIAVQTIKLVQNEDEVDSLKFFKEQHEVFCIMWNLRPLPSSHNFGGGQKEIFKWVVMQNCTLDQRRKIDAELKILQE